MIGSFCWDSSLWVSVEHPTLRPDPLRLLGFSTLRACDGPAVNVTKVLARERDPMSILFFLTAMNDRCSRDNDKPGECPGRNSRDAKFFDPGSDGRDLFASPTSPALCDVAQRSGCKKSPNASTDCSGSLNNEGGSFDYALASILIPVYNAHAWIAASIRSAIPRMWPRKEIVVVDDGLMDPTVSIPDARRRMMLPSLLSRIRALRQLATPHIRSARGTIQWLDADYLLAADKIERQLDAAERFGGGRRRLLSSAWAVPGPALEGMVYRYHLASVAAGKMAFRENGAGRRHETAPGWSAASWRMQRAPGILGC